MDVARGVLRWGDVQARRAGCTRDQVLGDTTYLIRFLTMSAKEFKRGVLGRGLLTTQEEQSLLFCIIRPGAWLPPHLDRLRTPLSTPRRWKPRCCGAGGFWTRRGKKTSPQVKPSPGCDLSERNFTALEKVFLCLACIFD